MFRILTLTLALSPLALAGCGTVQAIADYNAASDEFDAYHSEKAAKGEASYESGMALHAKYMANPMTDGFNIANVVNWYETQEQNLTNIDKLFEQLHYSELYEKIFLSHWALGQGWDKLVQELDGVFETGLKDARSPSDLLVSFDHAIETAQTYYTRVRDDYGEHHPKMVKAHADKVAEAKARIDALSVLKTKYRPK